MTYGDHYLPSTPSKFLLKSYHGDPGDRPRWAIWEIYDTLEAAQGFAADWKGQRTPGDPLRWTKSGGWENDGHRPEWQGIYEHEYTHPEKEYLSDPRWVVEEVPYIPR